MSLFELILIAVGVAMDCFAVSIVCGFVMQKFQWWPMMRIAFLFGLFQALMPCIGWLLGTQCYNAICRFDHWIAFGILALLGGKMVWEDLIAQTEEEREEENSRINPYRIGVVLTMATATSIDALAVGLSFSMLEINLLLSVCLIGIVSFLFSWTGMGIALLFGRTFHWKVNLAGGLILISIGMKILLEHLLT